MAGGAGTRFWPASRTSVPKQLLKMVGERSMIQSTVDRISSLSPPDRLMIATNHVLVPAIREQLPELPASSFLGEPCKRDTAPCVGLAAAIIHRRDPNAIMAVMPSDHVIGPDDVFCDAISAAAELVRNDPSALFTFGIQPTYPAEVFGYIERDESRPIECRFPAWQVRRFREKPDAATAAGFLSQGGFFWNAGIFVWNVGTILSALREFEPQMMEHIDRIAVAHGTAEFDRVFTREFEAIKGISIDFAVMERYKNVGVIQAPFSWDDLGSWLSLARLRGSDDNGNTVAGPHLGIRTAKTIVRSDDGHLIVTLGVSDLIIVHTPDATLVAHRDDEAAVKQVVDALKAQGMDQYL